LSQGDTPFKLIVGSMVLITLGCSTTKTVPLTQAITLNPSFAGAYYNRAVGYFTEKKCADARKDVRKAQDLGYQKIRPESLDGMKKDCPE